MSKQVTMSRELATKLYNGSNEELKALILENFPELASLKERVTSFEDVCREKGVNPNDYKTNSSDPKEIYLNGIKRILLITEVFQEGTKMDPHNTNQYKWYPWFDLEKSSRNPSGFRFYDSDYALTYALSVLGPLLWLPSEEICDYVGKTFEEEFKTVILIPNN